MVAVRGRGKGPTAAQLNAKVKERRQLALLQELRELTRPPTTKELLNPPVRGFPIDPTPTVRGRPIRPQTPTSVPTKSQIRQAVEPLRSPVPTPGTPLDDVSPGDFVMPLQLTQSEFAARRQALFPGASPLRLRGGEGTPSPVVAVSPLMGGSGGSYQESILEGGSVAASPLVPLEDFRQPDFDLSDIPLTYETDLLRL